MLSKVNYKNETPIKSKSHQLPVGFGCGIDVCFENSCGLILRGSRHLFGISAGGTHKRLEPPTCCKRVSGLVRDQHALMGWDQGERSGHIIHESLVAHASAGEYRDPACFVSKPALDNAGHRFRADRQRDRDLPGHTGQCPF